MSSICLTSPKFQNFVFQSNVSYYNPVTKKWQFGEFTLHPNSVEFTADTDDGAGSSKGPFHLSLPLTGVSSIEKKQSSFVFAALVITLGSESHWFASFPNRDSAYNLLELFWRDLLLSKPINAKCCTSRNLNGTASTELGKELLSILHESEKTLTDAAAALEEQGRQLHEAEETLEDVNCDMAVAEKFLSTMSFWPGISKPQTGISTNMEEEKPKEIRKRKYKVTFMPTSTPGGQNYWEQGVMVVSTVILLQDCKGNTKISFPGNEIMSIKVISPWEMCINHESERKVTSYNVMCPTLSRVLKVLDAVPDFMDKMFYDDGDDNGFYQNSSTCSSSLSMVTAPSVPSSPTVGWVTSDLPQLSEQVEQAHSTGSLTDEEVEEISTVLSNLQILATEVGKEQQSQMEKINNLITAVDKTEVRMHVDNKKIKKLT